MLISQAVGLLDDDIVSRFHIVIEHKVLKSSDQISIWRTLIKTLTRSRDYIEVEDGFVDSIPSEESELDWNVRRIQNGT